MNIIFVIFENIEIIFILSFYLKVTIKMVRTVKLTMLRTVE